MSTARSISFQDLPDPERIVSGGRSLLVRRLGRGPLLILLHGGPGLDHHLLLPLAVPLAKRFEVWLPDLPGHGGSHENWQRLPGLDGLRDDLGMWLSGLRRTPDVLCGHSLGAWLARELIRERQVSPGATVLLAPPAGGRTGSDSSVRRRARAASDFRVHDSGIDDDALAREELICFVTRETTGSMHDDFLEAAFLTRFRHPLRYASLLHQLHRTLLRPTSPCDAGPVLILCGDGDRTTPPRQAEAVAAATRDSRLVILENAGHFPFADGSPVTAHEIFSFLDEVL